MSIAGDEHGRPWPPGAAPPSGRPDPADAASGPNRPRSSGIHRHPVLRIVVNRLLTGLLVVWGAATIGFLSLQLLPGDPVRLIIGATGEVSPEVEAEIRRSFGLDRPVAEQYLRFLAGLVRGDLGTSYQLRQPVTAVLASEIGPTLLLAVTALALAFGLAVVVATLTAGRRGWGRAVTNVVELVLLSTPLFWVGVLLLTVFSFGLQLFPVAGNEGPASLVLPAFTIALPIGALFVQVLRNGLEEALHQPFALTARARGLSELRVRWGHALRHGLLSGITMAGWVLGGLLGGAVVTESVFSRQGLGRITLQAVENKDAPVVAGVLVVSAIVFVVVNLAVDLLYAAIDPRLRTPR